jgi:sigma-E factor negative regulatory protein RseA
VDCESRGWRLKQNNETLREMISAVVDGEASDFELRRVLDSMDDQGVRDLMSRHYSTRTVMRNEAACLCPPDVTAGIFAALDSEQALSSNRFQPFRGFLGGAAVAASVCLVAVLGVRALAPGEGAVPVATLAGSGSSGNSLGQLGRPAMVQPPFAHAATPLGLNSAVPVAAGTTAAAGMDARRLAEQRLRMFMPVHAQNAALNTSQGMMPYARVVGHDAP